MSIVRRGQDGSGVYVYADVAGFWQCSGCTQPGARAPIAQPENMIAHLREQHGADCVPAYALDLETYREEMT